MSVTIREVAKLAGVSTAAVSKVLHGRGSSVRVSAERAATIRAAAETLQYRPNALARNLRSSRTHTIGLYFEQFRNIAAGPLYYMHLLDGVASSLFNNHYRLTILPELSDNDVKDSLGDGLLEGVIWCKLNRDESTLKMLDECPIPVVAMSAAPPTIPSRTVFVSCDNESGMELAVDHLVGLGHRRIMFLREIQEVKTPDCIARIDGYQKAMRSRGLKAEEEDIATWTWDVEEFATWWATQPTYTAVVCWSERLAGQLLEAAARCGVRVPEELSVVGFDSTQYCESTKPRLTAVKQPIFDMSRHASETLLSLIRGQIPENYAPTFPCTLDVRDSTAPPRDLSHSSAQSQSHA